MKNSDSLYFFRQKDREKGRPHPAGIWEKEKVTVEAVSFSIFLFHERTKYTDKKRFIYEKI